MIPYSLRNYIHQKFINLEYVLVPVITTVIYIWVVLILHDIFYFLYIVVLLVFVVDTELKISTAFQCIPIQNGITHFENPGANKIDSGSLMDATNVVADNDSLFSWLIQIHNADN